ncbi:NAD(+)/NADH kinase [Deferribacterales bacterium RsTz2092]|nr:NAD kinase [Deferribacterales bacterium]
MIRSAAIIVNHAHSGACKVLESVASKLEQLGVKVLPECKATNSNADIIIAIGGDGTLLSAAQASGASCAPIFGIFVGKIGFIAEFDIEEANDTLELAVAGKLPIRRLMRVECVVKDSLGVEKASYNALNEIAINKGSRISEFNVYVNDKLINHYRADGYMVSTATGSTGYSLSVGGPIVDSSLRLMLLSPICAHATDSRSVLISPESVVRIVMADTRHDTTVYCDGKQGIVMTKGDEMLVRQSPFESLFYYKEGRGFFDHLANKLGWGATSKC